MGPQRTPSARKRAEGAGSSEKKQRRRVVEKTKPSPTRQKQNWNPTRWSPNFRQNGRADPDQQHHTRCRRRSPHGSGRHGLQDTDVRGHGHHVRQSYQHLDNRYVRHAETKGQQRRPSRSKDEWNGTETRPHPERPGHGIETKADVVSTSETTQG